MTGPVAWINIIRHPVERVISFFFFIREKYRQYKHLVPRQFFDKNINDCILNGDPECDYASDGSVYRENMIAYFCGNAIECMHYGNKEALQV